METPYKTSFGKYDLIKLKGTGTYGSVYKAKNKLTNEIVALKEVKTFGEKEGVASATIKEISLLKELNHENIVRFIEVISDSEKMFSLAVVMEYIPWDLEEIISETNDGHGFDSLMLKVSSEVNI